jgi:hypothetical protein
LKAIARFDGVFQRCRVSHERTKAEKNLKGYVPLILSSDYVLSSNRISISEQGPLMREDFIRCNQSWKMEGRRKKHANQASMHWVMWSDWNWKNRAKFVPQETRT